MGNEQTRPMSRFSKSEPLPSNSFCSFHSANGNESIIYFTDLCKPIETYIYARKKHPFTSYSAAKHPNAANSRLQTYDKNQWTFFNNTSRASTLALTIIFKSQVPLQKFPLLVRHTIPCTTQGIIDYASMVCIVYKSLHYLKSCLQKLVL